MIRKFLFIVVIAMYYLILLICWWNGADTIENTERGLTKFTVDGVTQITDNYFYLAFYGNIVCMLALYYCLRPTRWKNSQ
ncbi:hypothetical protein VQ7734_00134 [Vibrio quintilis]|uniref:Uncharacterized protein n=1 Tax=Vibrio quintilis TaxID=1117707 RepID=A0A1M7YP61_9VIBR|nr:hypothetical protein VQ7734_00134 [Vibrio quintilis]